MLAKKKKLGKKQIKEDRLVTFYSQSLSYFEDYKNQILIAAAVVIVVIAAIVYFSHESQLAEAEASAELSKVAQVFLDANYNAAINGVPQNNTPGLVEVVEKYSGTESGEIARVYLAHSYFYTGEIEKALENYKDYSGDNQLYKAASDAGIAACYETKGEFEKAADYYKDAAFVYENNPQNSEYLLNASINYIKAEQYADAKSTLEMLKEKYDRSTEAREADKYLAQIRIHSNS